MITVIKIENKTPLPFLYYKQSVFKFASFAQNNNMSLPFPTSTEQRGTKRSPFIDLLGYANKSAFSSCYVGFEQ